MVIPFDHITTVLAGASPLPVQVSAPIPGAEALFAWPWRVDFDDAIRKPAPPAPGPPAKPPGAPLRIQLLLIAQQADPRQALATLLACGRALEAHPIVRADGAAGRIVYDHLTTDDLCDVFRAAGVLMQPCLSYALTITEPS
jgi:hypothetical protein